MLTDLGRLFGDMDMTPMTVYHLTSRTILIIKTAVKDKKPLRFKCILDVLKCGARKLKRRN